MKRKKSGYKERKAATNQTEDKKTRRFALGLLLFTLAGLLVFGAYSNGISGYKVSGVVYSMLEGGALRIFAPAVCLKSDSDIIKNFRENVFERTVKTSLWVIAPAGNIKGASEDSAVKQEPMYADYMELRSQLNDTAPDDEIPEETISSGGTETLEETAAETQEAQESVEAPAETAAAAVNAGLPAATGMVYSLEQLQDFDFLKNSFYYVHSSTTVTPEQLNAAKLLEKDLSIQKDSSVPQILIYHTHAYEAFADSVEGGEDMTIVGAGNYLVELLTNVYGYNVIHDTTLYHYNDAYSEACEHISGVLAENPTVQLVIDLHRDAANEGTRLVTEINGKPTAKIMFFNGMCQTVDGPLDYVSNPYLESNLALSLQMKLLAEEYYPGLTRKNFLKAYRYNQHLMERSMLIEAGANTNTYEEVKNAMEPLAALLNEVLSGGKY